MKKTTLILLMAACLMSLLSACGHQHTWVGATCDTPKTCSDCKETEGTATGHIWVEATCTEPKTCSTCKKTEGEALDHHFSPATYTLAAICENCGEVAEAAKRDSIVFDNLTEYDLPFAFAFTNSDMTEIKEYAGLSCRQDDCSNLILSDFQAKPAEEDGYTAISFTSTVKFNYTVVYDLNNSDGGNYSLKCSLPTIKCFDFYSGKKFPIKATFNSEEVNSGFTLNNENGAYHITSAKASYNQSKNSDWLEVSSDVFEMDNFGVLENQFTIIVPSDYDGLCLFIEKTGVREVDFDTDDEDTDNLVGIFDPNDAGQVHSTDEYFFVRIADFI